MVIHFIVNASFHLTYPMAEDRWGTADDLASSRLQVYLSWAACVLKSVSYSPLPFCDVFVQMLSLDTIDSYGSVER